MFRPHGLGVALGVWLILVWQPRCPSDCLTRRIGGFASSSFNEYANVTGGNMLPMSADAIS